MNKIKLTSDVLEVTAEKVKGNNVILTQKTGWGQRIDVIVVSKRSILQLVAFLEGIEQ